MKRFLALLCGGILLVGMCAGAWIVEKRRAVARRQVTEARRAMLGIEPRLREIEDVRTLRASFWQKRLFLEQPKASAHTLATFACLLPAVLEADVTVERFRASAKESGFEFDLEGSLAGVSPAAARLALERAATAIREFPEVVLLSTVELGAPPAEPSAGYTFRIHGVLEGE